MGVLASTATGPSTLSLPTRWQLALVLVLVVTLVLAVLQPSLVLLEALLLATPTPTQQQPQPPIQPCPRPIIPPSAPTNPLIHGHNSSTSSNSNSHCSNKNTSSCKPNKINFPHRRLLVSSVLRPNFTAPPRPPAAALQLIPHRCNTTLLGLKWADPPSLTASSTPISFNISSSNSINRNISILLILVTLLV